MNSRPKFMSQGKLGIKRHLTLNEVLGICLKEISIREYLEISSLAPFPVVTVSGLAMRDCLLLGTRSALI